MHFKMVFQWSLSLIVLPYRYIIVLVKLCNRSKGSLKNSIDIDNKLAGMRMMYK